MIVRDGSRNASVDFETFSGQRSWGDPSAEWNMKFELLTRSSQVSNLLMTRH